MGDLHETISGLGRETLVDSVLLVDGDNDPHLPPDFPIGPRTLVKVFLRPDAKLPRSLERRLTGVPQCVTVVSPRGGSNAADFVMSLHAGVLHATLPLHMPFTLVTADKSLAAMAQELQRVGRQAVLWTSHPERGARGRTTARAARTVPARSTPGRRPRQIKPLAAPIPAGGRSLVQVAAAYFNSRIARVKDPPSRLKTLLNDIKNRTHASGYSPEDILAELKRAHGLAVDERGCVQPKPSSRS